MKRSLETEHRMKWPAVDDAALRSEPGGNLLSSDVIFYSRVTEKARFGHPVEVGAPAFDCVQRVLPLYGPGVDISSRSQRLKLHGKEHHIRKAPSMWASAIAHVVFVALWFFSMREGSFLHERLLNDVAFVEVSFGISEELSPSAPSQQNEGASDLDVEATKLAQQLPQLSKTFAVETEEKPQDAMPILTPTPIVATAAPTPKPVAVAEPTPPPNTRVLKAEEVLKRLEREQREVGAKNRAGTRQKGGKGVKDALSALPADPFASSGMSASNRMMGSLDGKLSAQARTYQIAALAHVRRHWSLSEFEKFEAGLSCQVEVSLNMLGKILGLKLLKTSGDSDFDEQVMAALEGSNPFPDFSDEGVERRTLVLNFRPREVK